MNQRASKGSLPYIVNSHGDICFLVSICVLVILSSHCPFSPTKVHPTRPGLSTYIVASLGM